MPKVKLTAADGIGDWVARKVKRSGMTQTELSRILNMTQPALSQRIRDNKFNYGELVDIFRATDTTDSEILKVMRGWI